MLLPKLSKLPESYEDEELTELFLIYYYDFYEWDAEFEEDSEELEELRVERKGILNYIKATHQKFYMNIKKKFDSSLFEELFNTIDQSSLNYKNYLKFKRPFKSKIDLNILLIQLQIMIKDSEFVDFLSGFPTETLKFIEK